MSTVHIAVRRAATGSAVLAVGLGLAGCSASDDSDETASAPQTARNGDVFNEADVRFATEMIPHHAQACRWS